MGCCGEPNVPADESNRAAPHNRQLIDQQPGLHPGAQFYEKQPTFQQPVLTAPTPTHPQVQNTYTGQNGYQPQQPSNWSQHSPSPPPVNQFGTFSPALTAVPGSSSNYSQTPFLQPSPVHNPSPGGDTSSPNTSISSPLINLVSSARQDFRAPSDEGKMSVAIDFGEHPLILSFEVMPKLYRHHIFRSG